MPGAGVIVAPGVLRGLPVALSGRFLFVKTPRGRPIRPAIAHWRAAACLNGPAFQTHGMPPASSASLLYPGGSLQLAASTVTSPSPPEEGRFNLVHREHAP